MRLIDADALKKAIPETTVDASTKYRYCVTFEREDVLAIIDAAPKVDIDRPTRSQFKRMAVQLGYEPVRHGKWVHSRYENCSEQFEIVKCSCCGHEAYAMAFYVRGGNYCPNCGAKMYGAE